ncbi:MAG: DNA repair protein RecO (recombination protein O) [Granulosicoccus sp.]|jgi:DNA repair protein RecO (recombination protein O)
MSSKAVELAPCYVLHTRPYSDTSLLVDVLTQSHGKLTLLARGARKVSKTKKNPRYLLQPFIPLLVSWQGKSTLKTLTTVEAVDSTTPLVGNALYSAMYANELLVYILKDGDTEGEGIYLYYQALLQKLSVSLVALDVCLREFEFGLLGELGYAIDFMSEAEQYTSLCSDSLYYYFLDQGFIDVKNSPSLSGMQFKGQDLINIGCGDYSALVTRQTAKYIARITLKRHLGSRRLRSRELFLK